MVDFYKNNVSVWYLTSIYNYNLNIFPDSNTQLPARIYPIRDIDNLIELL